MWGENKLQFLLNFTFMKKVTFRIKFCMNLIKMMYNISLFRKKKFPNFCKGENTAKFKFSMKKIAHTCQHGNIQILSPKRPFNQNLI